MAMIGFGLGSTLAGVRGWSPSVLVPGLLQAHVLAALAILSTAWLIFAFNLVFQNNLANAPVTLSLVTGLLALMVGASVHYWTSSAVLAIGWLSPLGPGIAWVYHPLTEWLCLIVTLVCAIELIRVGGMPPAGNEVNRVEKQAVSIRDRAQYATVRYASMLPLHNISRGDAFRAAMHHTRLQMWVNDCAGLVVMAVIVSGLFGIKGAASAEGFLVAVSAMTFALAVVVPLSFRKKAQSMSEQLWLAGFDTDVERFARHVFAELLRHTLHLTVAACVIVLLLTPYILSEAALGIMVSLILWAPGAAALCLFGHGVRSSFEWAAVGWRHRVFCNPVD